MQLSLDYGMKSRKSSFTIGRFFAVNQSCGFGEWPIFFAVCTEQPDLVQHLMTAYGARLDVRDQHVNSILHICVYRKLPKMYTFCEELLAKAGFADAKYWVNDSNLTPLV